MRKQKVESPWEKRMREENMKIHQKKIKSARKKGRLSIEHIDRSHIHKNLKKKQMEKDLDMERRNHDKNTKRRMDEYVSTIDNDGEYLLEWLKLLQQLRKQKDFNENSKYKNVHALYMQIVKYIPDLDLDQLPKGKDLIKLIKSKNPDLLNKLIAASTPRKRKKRRGRRGRGRNRERGRRRKKKKGNGMLKRLDEQAKTDEEYSSEGEGGEEEVSNSIRNKRRSSLSTTRRERNEQEERHRFLKAFLPVDLQTGIEDPESKENNKKNIVEEEDVIVTEKKKKKSELEQELEVKMAKEIWGFVFNHVKKNEPNIKNKNNNKQETKSKFNEKGGIRQTGGNDSNWDDDDMDEGSRRKRGGFSGLNNNLNEESSSNRRNMDDINEYSGEEEKENESNQQNKDPKLGDMDEYSGEEEEEKENNKERIRKRKRKKKKEKDPSLGDIDDYSGTDNEENEEEEEEGEEFTKKRRESFPSKINTSRRRNNKPEWERKPSNLDKENEITDDDDESITDDDEITPITSTDNNSFDWASSPVPKGYKPPRFSDYFRNSSGEEEGEEKRKSRPSSSYDEVEIDRSLVIENLSEYEFIGISMIWLKALSHFSHMFLFTPVLSIVDDKKAGLCKGGVWGHLKAGVVPTDPDGNWLTNHHTHAVEDPSLLIGRPFHFKLMIQSLKGDIVKRITDKKTQNDSSKDIFDENNFRKRKVETALFVKYQMDYIKDQRITDVCERISRISDETGEKEEGVLFHFEKEYSFPYMTKEVLFFLRNNAIRFEIYMKKKYLREDYKKTLFSL